MKSTSKVMRLSVVAVCLIAAAVLLTPNDASAASCYTTKSGDWNDTSVWGGCGSNYPGQSTNDYVTIKNGHTVTLNTSPGAIYFLEIEGGATFDGSSNTLTISSSGGTPGIYEMALSPLALALCCSTAVMVLWFQQSAAQLLSTT